MTVQDTYTEVCNTLLEPGGLQLGLVTQADFLSMFDDVFQDFLQQSGLIRKLINVPVTAGTGQYIEPDNIFDVQETLYSERLIHEDSALNLDQSVYGWRLISGPPRTWHEDRLAVRTIGVNPTPAADGMTVTMAAALYGGLSATSAAVDFAIATPGPFYGTIASFSGPIYLETTANMLGTIGGLLSSTGNLTLLAGVKLTKHNWQLTDLIEFIPDSLTPYLKYGVLAKIFSLDGEQRDVQRARYCAARLQEGVNLCKAIMEEELDLQEA